MQGLLRKDLSGRKQPDRGGWSIIIIIIIIVITIIIIIIIELKWANKANPRGFCQTSREENNLNERKAGS